MIGDGYHHGAVSWLMGALCFELGYMSAQPRMEQIVRREVCQLHVVRRNSCEAPMPRSSTVHLAESLTRWFLARTEARWSDVRLCTGELLQPLRISRQSVDPGLWRWRTSMAYCWKRSGSHINELESQAILMELRARSRKVANFSTVYLHLVDPQVALSIFTKNRTSSRLLQRVIRRANALCLAAHIYQVLVYVRSELNPADAPSRGGGRFVTMPGRVCLTNAQRKAWRGGKGSLKERQLSARCRTRYEFALQFFFGFLPFVVGTWSCRLGSAGFPSGRVHGGDVGRRRAKVACRRHLVCTSVALWRSEGPERIVAKVWDVDQTRALRPRVAAPCGSAFCCSRCCLGDGTPFPGHQHLCGLPCMLAYRRVDWTSAFAAPRVRQ